MSVDLVRPQLVDEAMRIARAAERDRVPLRLLGGVGIRILLGDRANPALRRESNDLDYLTSRRAAADVERLLGELGWKPNEEFNTLNGARRLLFQDPPSGHKLDVFVEAFEMCHKLPLAESLGAPGPTLPATDLALTKLQVVTLNRKDRTDLYALLVGLPLGAAEDCIDASRIATLTARDWGLHHTVEQNLARLLEGLDDAPLAGAECATIRERIGGLSAAIDAEPKTRAWKLRDRVGERKRWYDVPDEVDVLPERGEPS